MNNEINERRVGGIFGLLVGDALGVPFEFKRASDLPPPERIEMNAPEFWRNTDGEFVERSYRHIERGTYSDDGAQALCLLDSLRENNGLNLEHFGKKLVAWWDRGEWAVDAHPFDIGQTTAAALHRMKQGIPAAESGLTSPHSVGNGSLMRALPCALFFEFAEDAVIAAAMQSLPTHGHPAARVACTLYVAFAHTLLHHPGAPPRARDAWAYGVSIVQKVTRRTDFAELAFHLPAVLGHVERAPTAGSGYALDTLTAAKRILEDDDSYEDGVRRAIGLGNDTDTTAAATGGLLGIRHRTDGIPPRWFGSLRGTGPVFNLLHQLGWINQPGKE